MFKDHIRIENLQKILCINTLFLSIAITGLGNNTISYYIFMISYSRWNLVYCPTLIVSEFIFI